MTAWPTVARWGPLPLVGLRHARSSSAVVRRSLDGSYGIARIGHASSATTVTARALLHFGINPSFGEWLPCRTLTAQPCHRTAHTRSGPVAVVVCITIAGGWWGRGCACRGDDSSGSSPSSHLVAPHMQPPPVPPPPVQPPPVQPPPFAPQYVTSPDRLYNVVVACSDGIDNDGDGLIDLNWSAG